MARTRTASQASAAESTRRTKASAKASETRSATALPKGSRRKNGSVPAVTAVKAVNSVAEKRNGKDKKLKTVRDSFTMPEAEYRRIAALKQTCLALGIAVKKSELLRAGIAILTQLPPDDLKRAVQQIESIKTGRPASKAKRGKGERSKH